MGQVFDELKRRNVIRVAVAYLVASWLVLQVAQLVLEAIGAPAWVIQTLLLLFALGFPLALIFSWAYELTPEGIKKEIEVKRDQSITNQTARKLDLVTIGMLVAVLLVVGLERTVFERGAAPSLAVSSVQEQNSIAVLAFEDLSEGGDQAYFAQGLSEELLNVLAQAGDLKVAGRTSSFAFQGQNRDLREIGEILNVAHILEGSVRKAGDRIRVTAQLIKASDGFHLFSKTYDRDLEDIFAVQDEIAQEISTALLTEIVGTEFAGKATPTDTEVFELYLLARQRAHGRDTQDLREAASMLERALEIDPDYAPAVANKALVTYLLSDSLGAYGDTPLDEAYPIARALADRALALDDELAEAHAVDGLLLYQKFQNDEALVALTRALELNPNLSDAANWLSNVYARIDRRKESREILEEIVARDPVYGPAFSNLSVDYMRSGENDHAEALIDRVARIVGENDEILLSRGIVNVMQGESAKAVQNLRKAHEENPAATVQQMWYGFALLGVADFERILEVGIPEHRFMALYRMGRIDEALAAINDVDLSGGFTQRMLWTIGQIMNAEGQSREYIEFINERLGSIDDVLEEYPAAAAWGTSYLCELAYAYLQVGDEATFKRLLREANAVATAQDADGTENWVTWYQAAARAALVGDIDAAIAAGHNSIDLGYLDANGFSWSRIFDPLREKPEFKALEQRLADRVDANRAALGMPPYRPVAATDEKERPSSFVN